MFNKFWAWYQRHYTLNLTVATLLFFVQLFHLYWLFTDVILLKLIGRSFFVFPPIWGAVSTLLDYSEIPAIITTSILYIHLLRQKYSHKYLFYLLFLNIQWLHILWITDEVVIERFRISSTGLFHWSNFVAWIAILIDYLELPVIYDTAKKTIIEIKKLFN